MRHLLWTLSLLGLTSLGVQAAAAPACVATCEGNVSANFKTLGCTSAADAACLCAAPGFFQGILQCSQPTCAATEDMVKSYLNGGFCQAHQVVDTSSSTSSAAVSSTHSTSAAPSTVSAASDTTSSSHAASTSVSTAKATDANASTSSHATSQSTASSTPSHSSTASTASSSSSTASAAATTSSSSSAPLDNGSNSSGTKNGLSGGAIAGIAVACVVVGLAVIGAIGWMFWRRRKSNAPAGARAQPSNISRPMTGNARDVASPDTERYEKYSNDIEMQSNRYENMPPRQTPRTML